MRAVAAEPLTAISPHCLPLRGKARHPGKVDVALFVLSRGWLNGRELLAEIRAESVNVLGQRADYDNANAVARNARAAAISRGLCWQYIWVNYEETGDGKDHRLWTVTHEMVARPHPSWQKGDAVVVMENASGLRQHSAARARELAERSEAAVRGGLVRGVSDEASADAGSASESPKATTVGEGPARGTRRTQAAYCGSRPASAQQQLALDREAVA
jgi:hypothetical protein